MTPVRFAPIFVPFFIALAAGCGGGASDVGADQPDGGTDSSEPSATTGDAPDAGRPTGGDTAAIATPTPPPEIDCAAFAAAMCGTIDRCRALVVEATYGDQQTCTQRLKVRCEDAKAAPGSGMTASLVATCAAGMKTASCSDLMENRFAGCDILGTLSDGMACAHDEQCASGLCREGATQCGLCSPRGTAGVQCMETSECALGLVCPDGGGRCVMPGAPGASCDVARPCGRGLTCSTDKVCVTTAKAGEPCEGEDLVGSCDEYAGLFCGESWLCQTAAVARPGMPCGYLTENFVLCGGGGHCAGVDLARRIYTGVCSATAADGAACGAAASGKSCRDPARCIDSVCKLPSAQACR